MVSLLKNSSAVQNLHNLSKKVHLIFDISSLIVSKILRHTEFYQDLYTGKNSYIPLSTSGKRDCDIRFKIIWDELKKHHFTSGSYLDIGSQLGFFVFRMAENGFVSTGIELDEISIRCSRSLANLSHIKNVSFIHSDIDEITVDFLPVYDIISLLNVFHHLLYFKGKEKTDLILKRLYQKCNKAFIFETGQPNEEGFYWSAPLQKLMGNDYINWIMEYLSDLGFQRVERVAQTETHLSSFKRDLYVAFK